MRSPDKAGEQGRSSSLDEQLACILSRLDSFPLERFARMETELQQLKRMVSEEAHNYRELAKEIHKQSLGLHEAIEKQLDRAFHACRRERDLRLRSLSDQVQVIRDQTQERQRISVRVKLAIIGAGCALLLSLFSALADWLLRE